MAPQLPGGQGAAPRSPPAPQQCGMPLQVTLPPPIPARPGRLTAPKPSPAAGGPLPAPPCTAGPPRADNGGALPAAAMPAAGGSSLHVSLPIALWVPSSSREGFDVTLIKKPVGRAVCAYS